MSDLARCPKKRCRSALTFRGFDKIGRIVLVCEPCERNAQGKCRRCLMGRLKPRKIKGYGTGKFCPPCAKVVKQEHDAKRDRRPASRRYYWSHREQCVQSSRDYRAANPRTVFDTVYDRNKSRERALDPVKVKNDRAVARKAYARRMADPAYAATMLAKKRRYDRQKAANRRAARQLIAA